MLLVFLFHNYGHFLFKTIFLPVSNLYWHRDLDHFQMDFNWIDWLKGNIKQQLSFLYLINSAVYCSEHSNNLFLN